MSSENTAVLDPVDEATAGAEDTQANKYLTFVIGEEEFAIEIRFVKEINGIQDITELPDVPHYVKGVINLRGKVIPVLDVRLRFNMAEKEYDERTCIIVVDINDLSVGLIVDAVSEVLEIPPESIEPPPKVNLGQAQRYLQGMGKVGDEVKILLNTKKMLVEGDLELLAEAAD